MRALLASASASGTMPLRLTGVAQHDVRLAQVHLDTIHRVAVAVRLFESEDGAEPFASLSHVLIANVRQQSVDGNGAILHAQIIEERTQQNRSKVIEREEESRSCLTGD